MYKCPSYTPQPSPPSLPHPSQAKAQQQRDKLQEEKTQKSKIVTEKVTSTCCLSFRPLPALPSSFPRSVKPERHVMLVQSSGERRWKAGSREQSCCAPHTFRKS